MKHKLLLLLFSLAIFRASATSILVTDTSNAGTGSLRNAVAAALAGDTLDLSKFPSGRVLFLDSAITLNKSIAIIGRSDKTVTISSRYGNGNAFNTFQQSKGFKIYLKNLTFTQFSSTIYGYTKNLDIIAENCSFTNHNYIALAAADSLMSVYVNNCFFSNCYNAVRSTGKTTFLNSVVSGNRNEPLYVTNGPLLIENSKFQDVINSFSPIQVYDATATFKNLEFTGNKSSVLNARNTKLVVINTKFENNSGTADSPINLYLCDSVKFSRCIFNHNSGLAGGVINSMSVKYVQLDSCVFTNNISPTDGGAVYGYENNFDIRNCTFTNNQSNSGGGALRNYGLTKIINSTFDRNSSKYFYAGALFLDGPGYIVNSTFSNNSAPEAGAIYVRIDTTKIYSSTIAFNKARLNGGGIKVWTDDPKELVVLNLANTIVAGNIDSTTGAQDILGPVLSYGNNLIGVKDTITGLITSDLTGSQNLPLNPGLDLLANNGGFTMTHALLSSSPAIGKGSINYAFKYDQRGFLRGTPIDIGSFQSSLTGLISQSSDQRIIQLFPNPATSSCTLKGDAGNYDLQWFSSVGQLVKQSKVSVGGTISIDLPQGIYFVQILQGTESIQFQTMVIH